MKEVLFKTIKNLSQAIPIMLGILMLINILNPLLENVYPKVFTGNFLIDPFIGAIFGSISFGMPVTSYIIGGELLAGGVSLLAVSSFLLSWVTVGLAMLPLEAKYLGKRFSIARNIVNFVFALIISVLTVFTMKMIG